MCFVSLLKKKESILNGENLFLAGANSFILEWTPFPKGADAQESKREVIKAALFIKFAN